MKQLYARQDANGRDALELPPSDHINAYVLTPGAPQTVTVPAGATRAVFSSTDDFHARWHGGAASIPAASVTDGSGAEINPASRNLDGLTSFSLVAPRACVVACAFYG